MGLHSNEMKQESCQYFFYVCMLIVFPHESNRAKTKQKGILYFSIILGVQEEEYD